MDAIHLSRNAKGKGFTLEEYFAKGYRIAPGSTRYSTERNRMSQPVRRVAITLEPHPDLRHVHEARRREAQRKVA